MPKPPEPTSLILCDHLEVDPLQGGRMSLIDIFRTLSFPRFPTLPRSLSEKSFFAVAAQACPASSCLP